MSKDGIHIYTNKSYSDERGIFLKLFDHGLKALNEFDIQQVNYVTTYEKGTFRGLHYQEGSYVEAKWFRVIEGVAQIVFIDLRKGSTKYLQGDSLILDNPNSYLQIEKGFATGYLTLSDNMKMLYMSDNEYNPEKECGIRWDDPEFDFGLKAEVEFVSEKDQNWTNWNPDNAHF